MKLRTKKASYRSALRWILALCLIFFGMIIMYFPVCFKFSNFAIKVEIMLSIFRLFTCRNSICDGQKYAIKYLQAHETYVPRVFCRAFMTKEYHQLLFCLISDIETPLGGRIFIRKLKFIKFLAQGTKNQVDVAMFRKIIDI